MTHPPRLPTPALQLEESQAALNARAARVAATDASATALLARVRNMEAAARADAAVVSLAAVALDLDMATGTSMAMPGHKRQRGAAMAVAATPEQEQQLRQLQHNQLQVLLRASASPPAMQSVGPDGTPMVAKITPSHGSAARMPRASPPADGHLPVPAHALSRLRSDSAAPLLTRVSPLAGPDTPSSAATPRSRALNMSTTSDSSNGVGVSTPAAAAAAAAAATPGSVHSEPPTFSVDLSFTNGAAGEMPAVVPQPAPAPTEVPGVSEPQAATTTEATAGEEDGDADDRLGYVQVGPSALPMELFGDIDAMVGGLAATEF